MGGDDPGVLPHRRAEHDEAGSCRLGQEAGHVVGPERLHRVALAASGPGFTVTSSSAWRRSTSESETSPITSTSPRPSASINASAVRVRAEDDLVERRTAGAAQHTELDGVGRLRHDVPRAVAHAERDGVVPDVGALREHMRGNDVQQETRKMRTLRARGHHHGVRVDGARPRVRRACRSRTASARRARARASTRRRRRSPACRPTTRDSGRNSYVQPLPVRQRSPRDRDARRRDRACVGSIAVSVGYWMFQTSRAIVLSPVRGSSEPMVPRCPTVMPKRFGGRGDTRRNTRREHAARDHCEHDERSTHGATACVRGRA